MTLVSGVRSIEGEQIRHHPTIRCAASHPMRCRHHRSMASAAAHRIANCGLAIALFDRLLVSYGIHAYPYRETRTLIPMGTVVTCCMFIGLLFASPLLSRAPQALRWIAAAVVGAAGGWNVFWYALQNIPQKWGWLALISGVLMILTSLFIARPTTLPGAIQRARWPIMVALLACAIYYAQTIYHL